MSQNDFVFTGTVYDNLTFGRKFYATEFDTALRQTRFDHIVQTLPNGFDTMLGLKNYQLSQGMLQRLALTRCLLQGAKVIFLDEPETSLDVNTIDTLSETVATLKQNHLIIIVSHSKNFDSLADKVCFLDRS